MNLVFLKNNVIIGRVCDEAYTPTDIYSIVQFESIPDYPEEDAGFGKEWKLTYNAEDTTLSWVLSDRELTVEEKLQQRDEALEALELLGVE